MKMNNFLYYLKNLTFIGFLISFIYLLPNVNYTTTSGKLFVALIVVYAVTMMVTFIIKSEKSLENKLGNFVTSMLHVYTMIIVFRVLHCEHHFCVLSPQFLKINYIIITVVVVAIFLDSIFFKSEK